MSPTIFVSVASYRDKICPVTLESLYKNADHPANIYVGICQQNDVNDVDCIVQGMKNLKQYTNNVRIIRLGHRQAKGPTYARFLCSTLYDNEDFYLQIDSHCRFARHWDTILIKMIHDLKRHGVMKPVLSHYTPSYDEYKEDVDEKAYITTICKAWFTDQNLISLEGAGWTAPEDIPRPNAYIAAGMFFCEGKFLKEIPFDPELDFVFVGEELLLSARFFTHGWDIFSPNRNVIYHAYTREKDPKFWDNQHMDAEPATQRVRFMLGLDSDKKLTPRQLYIAQLYGLGTDRSLDDYFSFAGIDLKTKKVLKDMCNLSSSEIYSSTPHPLFLTSTLSPRRSKKKLTTSPKIILIILFSILGFICLCLFVLWISNFSRLKAYLKTHNNPAVSTRT